MISTWTVVCDACEMVIPVGCSVFHVRYIDLCAACAGEVRDCADERVVEI